MLDLDGTLYQDPKFISRYMNQLVKGSDHERTVDRWIAEAITVLEGRHPVKPGMFYDSLNDIVFEQDGMSVTNKLSWGGERLDKQPGQEPGTELPAADIHYIGDEWGIITVLARRMELTDEQRRAAFLAVREEMIAVGGIEPHEHLISALKRLNIPNFRKILITNAPAPTGFAFVSHLGLDGLFDSYIFDGGKPELLTGHMHGWMQREELTFEEVVSIGDNAWNDLYPVKREGGRTVWVSRYDSLHENLWDLRVRSMDELAMFLERLAALKESAE
ncbi:HAD family hydrolase [Paenibacillus sepulcri]|uniref:HAD family hydrolase n=1 Tax=Paenibacillus sepulcri TaxID=359917 RepID=A0ABS7C3A9_9BACL|nr:HAD family hydrolase [Paenibacillus sepulcri]